LRPAFSNIYQKRRGAQADAGRTRDDASILVFRNTLAEPVAPGGDRTLGDGFNQKRLRRRRCTRQLQADFGSTLICRMFGDLQSTLADFGELNRVEAAASGV
jgi:hypothetical protein